ncbi:hypothetical protein B2G71_08315 [Novosphingobium sp. PC22D]|nr:hypothetical protein B2G71_08315 [Novosphingobium sp. PC22D]
MDTGLHPADFARLAGILTEEVGIKLPASKRTMLEGRMRSRIRALGFEDHASYCAYVFEGGGLAEEFIHLIDAVTTNKTDFFREADHYDCLRDMLVPELLRLRKHETDPVLRVWSVASSIGAELWSAGMILDDIVRSGRRFDFTMLGTDISTSVLRTAVRAVYPLEFLAPVPDVLRKRYLLQPLDGKRNPTARIVPELRGRARFTRLNLMDSSYPLDGKFDVAFLRNVLIYFERDDQEAVVRRVLSQLRTGGYLILGHSEAPVGSGLGLNQVHPAVFRKEQP